MHSTTSSVKMTKKYWVLLLIIPNGNSISQRILLCFWRNNIFPMRKMVWSYLFMLCRKTTDLHYTKMLNMNSSNDYESSHKQVNIKKILKCDLSLTHFIQNLQGRKGKLGRWWNKTSHWQNNVIWYLSKLVTEKIFKLIITKEIKT